MVPAVASTPLRHESPSCRGGVRYVVALFYAAVYTSEYDNRPITVDSVHVLLALTDAGVGQTLRAVVQTTRLPTATHPVSK